MTKERMFGVRDFLPIAAGLSVFAAGCGVLWWIKRYAEG